MVFPGNLILIGSLLSCLILFGFPCLVLGATSPCLIKAGTKTLENNGRIAGQIYGLSTLGSICGTFLPTFITIPIIGTNKTFFLFAGILCALSIFYSLFHGSPWKERSLVVIILIGALSWPFSLPYAFWEKPIVETESIYNFLMVKKDEVATVLSTHVFAGVQSAYFQDPGLTGLDAFDEDHPLSKLSKAVKAQLEEVGESSLIFTDDLAPVEIIGFHMLNQQIKDGFREILIRFILSLKEKIS